MTETIVSDLLDSRGFGEKLAAAFESAGHLCVGIDPHPYLLERWQLPDSAAGVRDFGLRVVEAAAGRAAMVKPQVAFFERHGAEGFAALEEVLAAARATDLLVIGDAKRGDVGTSVEAYGQAWLTPGSPLEVDALTVSAFQGVGSLDAVAQLARDTGKGLFVLAATSNPESRMIQTAVISGGEHAGMTVSASIVAEVNSHNDGPLGFCGVVIGATVSIAGSGINEGDLVSTPILAPGFGHQGAQLDDLHTIFGSASHNVIVSSSRAILDAGPAGITDAITAHSRELVGVFSR